MVYMLHLRQLFIVTSNAWHMAGRLCMLSAVCGVLLLRMGSAAASNSVEEMYCALTGVGRVDSMRGRNILCRRFQQAYSRATCTLVVSPHPAVVEAGLLCAVITGASRACLLFSPGTLLQTHTGRLGERFHFELSMSSTPRPD